MRVLVIGMALALGISPATAQLVGTPGAVGQTLGAAGGVTRGVGDAVADSTDAAGDQGAAAVGTATARRQVKVAAGASIRVERGTRCYYDDYYYDPVYRDGTYYCERSGSTVGAKAGAAVKP